MALEGYGTGKSEEGKGGKGVGGGKEKSSASFSSNLSEIDENFQELFHLKTQKEGKFSQFSL
jgi:hypothetical protein